MFRDKSIEENMAIICSTWLDTASMPQSIVIKCQNIKNPLWQEMKSRSNEFKTNSRKRKLCEDRSQNYPDLMPEQWILFLEDILPLGKCLKNKFPKNERLRPQFTK